MNGLKPGISTLQDALSVGLRPIKWKEVHNFHVFNINIDEVKS